MDAGDLAQAIVGLALVAFLPGWVWSHVLLPTLAPLGRAVAAVVLSVALMALALAIASSLGLPIDASRGAWISLALSAAGAAAWVGQRGRLKATEP